MTAVRTHEPLVTLDYVAKLHDELRLAQAALREAAARRDQAILMAVESGSQRVVDIARRLDVSPGRVSQTMANARSRGVTA